MVIISFSLSLFLFSYLEHQNEQQPCRHDCVHLALPGQGVEICEGVPRVLHVQRPLILGHGAAAQVQPAHKCCQRQFTDAQESPGWQQVPVALSEEAQDPPHQEVQHQDEENDLENKVSQSFIAGVSPKLGRPRQGYSTQVSSGSLRVKSISRHGGLPGVTVRRSCRSRLMIGHRVMTWRSRLDRARSETGNSNRKEKTARRFVLML